MASFIAKKISTKILGETMENKWGVQVSLRSSSALVVLR